ncbi:MAG: hemolysin family protein [Pseudomonadota bacterium]
MNDPAQSDSTNAARSDADAGNGASPGKPGKSPGSIWSFLRSKFSGDPETTLRASIEDVIGQHDADEQGDLSAEERLMLQNILQFGQHRVADVMVPRADIIAVEAQTSLAELFAVFIEANHSRIPVYREALDEPLGMVHIKDLVNWIAKAGEKKKSANGKNGASAPKAFSLSGIRLDKPVAAANIMRDVLFVPPSMPAADLLVKMQSTHIHMALVVDEYGGTDGLVSIEDLVEEIVGEIVDEHDEPDGPLISSRPDGTLVADARAPIEELEELLKVDLVPDEDEDDADTLGGLVFTLVGRVPTRGELVRHSSGLAFEVLEADARRLKRLKVHPNGHAQKAVPRGDPGAAASEGGAPA